MKKSPTETTLTPRKTPRQSRSSSTVAAILEGAAHILETAGFDGYSTNAIAQYAGVSIGSLYQYFPNKTAITRALIEREMGLLLAELAVLETTSEGMPALQGLLEIAVRHQLRRPVLARMLDVEEARLPIQEDVDQAGTTISNILRNVLQDTSLVLVTNNQLCEDLLAIIKGMVDAAGQRGENDAQCLLRRVEYAVYGYIDRYSKDFLESTS
ncbi:TetR/AcrR family transcriptional regulator [Pseudomonas yamanorum]|uniref:TetR/AcrR family transcriptional regulator n=1 Tax=Pseudomonas yamanorum TaxID=515393 RepID=UPI0015A287E7|nr:TetR/AcrR family transcriptional regulator [Pseudomonas yamanorum]NWD25720.1 TetR/AcrR family transcriptional regulator [Pseudomonas yamanorum]